MYYNGVSSYTMSFLKSIYGTFSGVLYKTKIAVQLFSKEFHLENL